MRSRETNVFSSEPLKVVLFIDSCCTGQAECIHHFTFHNAVVHILWLLSLNLEGSCQCKVFFFKFQFANSKNHLDRNALSCQIR